MINSLKRGRKYFEKDNCEYGLAKINLLEAEFQIDNKYGTGIILNYNSKEVKNLAEVNRFDNEIYEAKRNLEESLKIIKKNKDKN